MRKLALLFGVSEYENPKNRLEACKYDLQMMNSLLQSSGEFSDILVSLDDTASSARDKIIEFIEKYKDEEVEQVVFYFSGHGYRQGNEFYFCFKTTDTSILKSTTISSQDMDEYLKILEPSVAVKIIDACYSGEHYIKDIDDSFYKTIEEKQRKSFNEIYFMFSSRNTEVSHATKRYSLFTQLFFEAIRNHADTNAITYKAIIDYVSDYAQNSLSHTPIFVTQGAHMAYLFSDLEVPKQILLDDSRLSVESKLDENLPCTELISRVLNDASEYCNEILGVEKLNFLVSLLEKLEFSDDLSQLFDITMNPYNRIPFNSSAIGRWLNTPDVKKRSFLARVEYEEYTATEQQYVEKPYHPFYQLSYAAGDMYELQDVKVKKSRVSGIKSLLEIENIFFKFTFTPKIEFPNLQHYAVSMALLSSKKEVIIFYCIEELVINGWNNADNPKCLEWLQYAMPLKDINLNSLTDLSEIINKDIIKKIEQLLS
ncbi:caspase family protein [Wohlfahrtiimonas larvae]|uniref:Peptidase C14 caspase domain-containing protein n=1 Tax=Wohlfahrtiimonas larvae TaxID=1157986 RepID=A0ABP9MUN9_9GAMM|nr:caspase family protein [Wohlfahrtiimonas larvae]